MCLQTAAEVPAAFLTGMVSEKAKSNLQHDLGVAKEKMDLCCHQRFLAVGVSPRTATGKNWGRVGGGGETQFV